MNAILAAALLVVAAGLAGCLSSDDAPLAGAGGTSPDPGSGNASRGSDGSGGEPSDRDAPVEDADEPPGARVDVTVTNGTTTGVGLAADLPGVEPVSLGSISTGENAAAAFTPDEDLAGIVVELAWTDSVHALDLYLFAPDHEWVTPPELNGTSVQGWRGHMWGASGGNTGMPGNHVVIHMVDEDMLAMEGEWSWGVNPRSGHDLAFTVIVSLFYGEAPPDAYTAFTD